MFYVYVLKSKGDSNCDADIGAFWRIADGTEGSTVDVIATSSDEWMGFYLRISGADTSNPIKDIEKELH